MSNLRIMFFGTPDFAREALCELHTRGENIVGVVATPDKQKGRGMKLVPCDVKAYALENSLPVYTPESLKDGAISQLLQTLRPDVIVVAAYGKILPEYVLDFPKYGCVNIHGSILPKYRGAAPIQRAVLDGEEYTGVTTMLMDRTLDTGDILLCEKVKIGENETSGELFDRLAKLGAKLLVRTLDGLEKGEIVPQKQSEIGVSYAEKITKQEARLDFSKDAFSVHKRICGLSPFPAAYCYLRGVSTKLYESFVIEKEGEYIAGRIYEINKEYAVVGCARGKIGIRKFKPEGSGAVCAKDMQNGRKMDVGDILE